MGIQGTLELILDRLTALEKPPANPNGGGLLPLPVQEDRPNRQAVFLVPPPKRELPSFEGQKPKARMQEKALEAVSKKKKTTRKPYTNIEVASTDKVSTMPANKTSTYRLNLEVYEYRKTNHLCFKCGEKYAPGHQCRNKQLNYLFGENENSPEAIVDQLETQIGDPNLTEILIEGEVQQEVLEAICLSALARSNSGVNSILVRSISKNMSLTLLVDFGSTHSFIDEQAVKDTGHVPIYNPLMRVTVADGNYVMCNAICAGFSWKMQGSLSLISGSSMGKLLRKGHTLMTHLFMVSVNQLPELEGIADQIHEVLGKYNEVFAEPKALPPVRSLDHQIPLTPGATPVSLIPYMYNYYQKEELEKQPQVEYLGHVINAHGVAIDPGKTFDKSLEEGFRWSEEANQAFADLKRAMSTTPVLALPDYSQPFVVETDACHSGIGAVLMQNWRLVVYFSKRQQMQQLLKDNLQKAQERMKLYTDQKRTERAFQVGDMACLKLQPYRQTSLALRKNLKLSSKYYEPYQI
ncbi:hypothetical protein A4A49_14857 [Nicotiana attenuata]|uniref:Reverse transcriptase/retrotransposon-derived protein RNase H-like domain-containing protein n=1 Tax=Nicotiana attenuata TaxID=49451 RepID=A0A314KUM8_NICAT|nr:hypothetical protein A4A49_14857 [Nicotiana attenuata]